MKAYLINPAARCISEVQTTGTIIDLEKHLPYKYWETPHYVSKRTFLLYGQQCDFTGEQHYTIVEGKHIYGNIVVIGGLENTDIPEGGHPITDCPLTMEQVETNVAFPRTTETVPTRGVRKIADGIYAIDMGNIEEVHDFLQQIIGD
ncbi:MAG: hypothetical protein KGI54_06980 [Pseudomonadota bacterium]|nr:hypothetical protein [Pseudomonadota bacterium]